MNLTGDDPEIGDHEIVLRRVARNEVVADENTERMRPAGYAFLQGGRSGLVSVYLASETTPAIVSEGGPEEYLASIAVERCDELAWASSAMLPPAGLDTA